MLGNELPLLPTQLSVCIFEKLNYKEKDEVGGVGRVGKEGEEGREREYLSSAHHLPNGIARTNRAGLEEARSFFLGAQELGPFSVAFPFTLVGSCIGSRAAGPETSAHRGCWTLHVEA